MLLWVGPFGVVRGLLFSAQFLFWSYFGVYLNKQLSVAVGEFI